MFIEIERKFELTDNDYHLIKTKLAQDSQKVIEDIYMDLSDLSLIKNKMKFRLRN